MIFPQNKLSLNAQLEVLGLSKGSYYYAPRPESEENLSVMAEIDRENTEYPTVSVVGLCDHLRSVGYRINAKRVRRLMRKMCTTAIYPRKSLTKQGNAEYRMPYLLLKLKILRPNQVWNTDITYVPMTHGFMYLIAIIDVYSRGIMAWGLYNTMEKENCAEVLDMAVAATARPKSSIPTRGVNILVPFGSTPAKSTTSKSAWTGKAAARTTSQQHLTDESHV